MSRGEEHEAAELAGATGGPAGPAAVGPRPPAGPAHPQPGSACSQPGQPLRTAVCRGQTEPWHVCTVSSESLTIPSELLPSAWLSSIRYSDFVTPAVASAPAATTLLPNRLMDQEHMPHRREVLGGTETGVPNQLDICSFMQTCRFNWCEHTSQFQCLEYLHAWFANRPVCFAGG